MMSHDKGLFQYVVKKTREVLFFKRYNKNSKSMQQKQVPLATSVIGVAHVANIFNIAVLVFAGCTIIISNPYKNMYGNMIDFFAITRYSGIVLTVLAIISIVILILLIAVLYLKDGELKQISFFQKALLLLSMSGLGIALIDLYVPFIGGDSKDVLLFGMFVFLLFALLTAMYKQFTFLGYIISIFALSCLGISVCYNIYLVSLKKSATKYEYKIQGISEDDEIKSVMRFGDMIVVKTKKEPEIVLPLSAFISARPIIQVDNNTKSDNASKN